MSFQQGLSGLNAAAKNLDIIGNNVSNSNTIGYKGSSAQFADVYANSVAGGGISVGIGTSLSNVQQTFAQGNINVSSNPMDIAINGSGFFRMSSSGAITFARNGQFHLDKSGYMINAAGARLTGYPADATGTISSASAADLVLSSADLSPKATTTTSAQVNMDARATALTATAFDPTDTATFNSATSMSVSDSQGNAHTLSLYFVKTAANTWQVMAAQDGTQIGAANVAYASGIGPVGTVVFLTTGAIDTAASTALPLNLSGAITTGATTPLAYTLDLTGSTQFGSAFGVNQLDQDGYGSGRLSGFSTSADGVILGRYSNGQSRAQGQVVLANFTNPNGLQPLGSNNWAETPTSGAPLVGAPSTGSLGVLQAGALEDSNIDLTAELVNMITAQRVYQANAQSIKTQDSVLQTLVNLR
ncbi:MAG: flagellar hook protein FlgE [Betaproteobacteria bacterium]